MATTQRRAARASFGPTETLLYTAYGLGIRSELPLPELTPGAAKADVTIRLDPLGESAGRLDGGELYRFWTIDDAVCLCWRQVGTFTVRGGEEIIVSAAPQRDDARLRLFLLGAAMGMLLHQRGLPVFHASAVAIDGRAVAFLGGRGWGKSTAAATLHARGHRVIADDVMALDMSGSGAPVVVPAFPQLKLWPDALDFLGESPEAFQELSLGYRKRARPVFGGFSDERLPLDRVYVLDTAPDVRIEALQPRDALLALLGHYYTRRFGELTRSSQRAEFLQCAEIVDRVRVHRLSRPADLRLLPSLATLVEHAHRAEY